MRVGRPIGEPEALGNWLACLQLHRRWGRASSQTMTWRLPLVLLLLAGCAGGDKGTWPSLAPRANEVSPLVPRVPLGACAGCTSGEVVQADSPPPALLGPPQLPALPDDAGARLAAMAVAIGEVEARLPAARVDAQAALSRAVDAEDRDSEADVQASRFEALFLPLGEIDAELALIEEGLAARPELAALAAEAAALRARLQALETLRVAGL